MKLEQIFSYIKQYSFEENHEKLFQLVSGKRSSYYLDLKQTLLDPQSLHSLGSILFEKINRLSNVEAVSGLTLGADPLTYTVSLASLKLAKPWLPLIVRKETKDHGTGKKIEGKLNQLKNTSHIVLLDDVITTGNSTLKAVHALKESGYKNLTHAFCVVDREEGGKENLLKEGIELISLFKLKDFATK